MAGEIYIADKATLDAANTKLGTNADVAGTTTIFARLKQIYDHIASYMSSTRMAKVDNLDVLLSTRASSTALTALDTKIGIANPSVGDTTTVMNFLKKIDSKGDGADWSKNVPFNIVASCDRYSPNITVCNITGKGFFSKALCMQDYAMTQDTTFKITVDGVVVGYYTNNWAKGIVTVNHSSGNSSGSYNKTHVYPIANAFVDTTTFFTANFYYGKAVPIYPSSSLQTTASILEIDEPIFFNSSLKVEMSMNNQVDRKVYAQVQGGLL